jgi:pyruvate dehydrogenase E2 component (dihydrolipoamide acetyltransferase)
VTEPGPAAGAKGSVETVEPTAAQQAHARRVAEAKATVPHAYVEAEATLASPERGTTGAIVQAAGAALREFPLVNGAYRDARFELHSRVNVAVATEAEDTVAYPVVQDADSKDAAAIDAELTGLAERARDGSITSPQLAGATFTITDLSSTGIARGTGAVVRGQAAHLTVAAPSAEARSLSLACDARILQGPEAAGFLARLKALLETG